MAELIDKDMLVEALAISRHHHASSNRENELLYRAENIVREQPTVTEAEIRAKAIDEFYDKVLNFEDYIEPLDTSEFGAVLLYSGKDITNMIVKIAEEMRGAE